MRPFQKGNSFHDDEGNLLHGRVIFYKRDTSTKQDIYDVDGNVLANPIYTNDLGQTSQQVFLDDVDYLVSFERYIGDGNMETDTDERHWLFIYSCIDLYDTFNINIDTNGMQVVNTIADLRRTDPSIVETDNGNKVVLLAGYFEYGDKPSIQYVWNPTSNEPDNGGSVIKVDGISLGRWKIIPNTSNTLDVRHFGAMPSNSYIQISVEQAYAIQQANEYASMYGIKLYFPNGYYRLDTNISNVIMNGYVLVPDGMDVTISGENVKVCQANNYNGDVTIIADIIHLSDVTAIQQDIDYSIVHFNPIKRFVVDIDVRDTLEIENVECEFHDVSTIGDAWVNITNCQILANHTISNTAKVGFWDCYINGSYFKNDLSNASFTNCTTDYVSWTDMNNYIVYLMKNGDKIIDLGGKSVSQTITIDRDIIVKNAVGLPLVLGNNVGNVTIQDSSVAISSLNPNFILKVYNSIVLSDMMSSNNIILENSTYRNDSPIVVKYLSAMNSTIEGNESLYVTTAFSANNSLIDKKFFLTLPNGSYPQIDGCVINKEGHINCNMRITNCTISSTITQSDVNGVVDFIVQGNVFNTYGSHKIYSNTPNGLVVGTWNNNVTLKVEFDRTNLDTDESHHTYKIDQKLTVIHSGTIADFTATSWVETDIVGIAGNELQRVYTCWSYPYEIDAPWNWCDIDWIGVGQKIDVLVDMIVPDQRPIPKGDFRLGSYTGATGKGSLRLLSNGKYRLYPPHCLTFIGDMRSPAIDRQPIELTYRIQKL